MADFESVASKFVTYSIADEERQLASNRPEIYQFTEFYYNQFDADRKQLAPLYSLPFEKVKHQVSTLDAQPSGQHGGILILITGALLVDEEQRPMNYSQAFQLMPDGAGSYFIFNDVFKLVFG
ncbi:hypothetical protein BPOR_0011g00220 [Botrytis porri]|uniref:Nuclear transport factor 2 n=1 Tax=Botrytis porri TaxID=87229 RepID=A0A4Z1L5C9_9HELO|nr:hypothetical protein BPOR_0011g00220 [Botrytis porri]